MQQDSIAALPVTLSRLVFWTACCLRFWNQKNPAPSVHLEKTLSCWSELLKKTLHLFLLSYSLYCVHRYSKLLAAPYAAELAALTARLTFWNFHSRLYRRLWWGEKASFSSQPRGHSLVSSVLIHFTVFGRTVFRFEDNGRSPQRRQEEIAANNSPTVSHPSWTEKK